MDKIGTDIRLYENTINAGDSQMFYVNARAFVERQVNNTTEIIFSDVDRAGIKYYLKHRFEN